MDKQSRYLPTPVAPINIGPVVLEGQHIRLEPLSYDHHAALCEIGLDEDLWRWIPSKVQTPDDLRKYIETALQHQAEGSAVPFATILKASGDSVSRVIGSTRYMNIDKGNRRVEIGSTWIGKNWQRTAVNTEAKYLMLRHAFEVVGCLRVELKTDFFNEQSRNAILRLGAKQEGIFRSHVIAWNGRVRDSVYFSIIDTEWPTVKTNLEEKLAKPR